MLSFKCALYDGFQVIDKTKTAISKPRSTYGAAVMKKPGAAGARDKRAASMHAAAPSVEAEADTPLVTDFAQQPAASASSVELAGPGEAAKSDQSNSEEAVAECVLPIFEAASAVADQAAKSDQGNPEMSLAGGLPKKTVREKRTITPPPKKVKAGAVQSGHGTRNEDREWVDDIQHNYKKRLCDPYKYMYTTIYFKDKLSIAHMIFASGGIFYMFFGEKWMDKVHCSCIGVDGPIADISVIRFLQKPRFHRAILYSNDHFMHLIERGRQALGLDGGGNAAALIKIAKQALSSFDLVDIPLRLMERGWVQSDGHSCGRRVLKAIAALLSNAVV
jgi:hypothetical protein